MQAIANTTLENHTSITENEGQAIQVAGISKSWGGVKAVEEVTIEIPAGTFTVLLGPSGCGKSTTLRIIAGLEYADSGTIHIGDRNVTETPPVKRDLAMVFQSYALFPHLNVAENILFGLKVRRVGRNEQNERLQKTATMLGLADFLHRKPSQLSGGQQQRVALGRAIIAEKPVCLMDEPLSNLDAKLRNSMRTEIRDLQQKLGFSMVYVTHDQAEAITMADQVVVMREGRVEQAGTPREIYESPATSFVAGFIGTPPMNLIDCALLNGQSKAGQSGSTTEQLLLGVRPENIRLGDSGFGAIVEHVEYMGADLLVECRVNPEENSNAVQAAGNATLLARVSGAHQVQVGQRVSLQWDQQSMHFFSAATRQRISDPPESLLAALTRPG
ncbi:ABC transporter ATP-binding protein [Chromatiales bacterium (ex Bugula neritina AB1)]|nr:ABC transporter ATP-binding protein [Chromatiales bacterium (ex Bugula neritina AB1)]